MPARKPTSILEARGAFKKNKSRSRPYEPNTGRGIGPPPAYLKPNERAAWDKVIAACAPGVFQSSDADSLEVYSRVMAAIRRGRSPTGTRLSLLLQFWTKFGMTPLDRSKIFVSKLQEDAEKEAEVAKVGLAKFL